MMGSLIVHPLGQVGYVFTWLGTRVVIDPYLFDSVAERFGDKLRRRVAPTLSASDLSDVSWILITHAHLDHCDPASLRAIRSASPTVHVVAPRSCHTLLCDAGFDSAHIAAASSELSHLGEQISVRAIPAAHTQIERDTDGEPKCVGYVLNFQGGPVIYHAGDTIPHPAIFDALDGVRPDFAFLPVNERNFFRDEADIVGNMTIREAFGMAERVKARTLVPTHWDLFAPNGTFPWEIESLYKALNPPFNLRLLPCGEAHSL